MQFEVPQFIEIEDKIFGPLTWRQFLYLGGGIGIAVVLFLIDQFLLFLFIGLPLAALGGLLAYFPINKRPFSEFLNSVFQYFSTARLYTWKRRQTSIHKAEPKQADHIQNAGNGKGQSLSSLSRKLELEALNQ